LVIDDARRVDVLPADIFLDAIASHLRPASYGGCRSREFRPRRAGDPQRVTSLTKIESKTLTTVVTRAPTKAAQRLETWKPRPSEAERRLVNQRITALMTKVKSPSVRIISGQLSSVRTGRTSAFKSPKTSATARK